MGSELRRYIIQVEGFSDEEFIAETASKARYMAWKAWCEAGNNRSYPGGFIDFAKGVYTLHLGPARDLDPRTPAYGVGA